MPVTQRYKTDTRFVYLAKSAAAVIVGCLVMMAGPILESIGWIGN
jgi:hypothetical protein